MRLVKTCNEKGSEKIFGCFDSGGALACGGVADDASMGKVLDADYTGLDGVGHSCAFVYRNGADALLYLSTHGLYLDAHLALQFSYYNKRYDRRVLEDNGATKFWFSDTPVGENEDETISAQEISEMDLSGVSLAVLAACENRQSSLLDGTGGGRWKNAGRCPAHGGG